MFRAVNVRRDCTGSFSTSVVSAQVDDVYWQKRISRFTIFDPRSSPTVPTNGKYLTALEINRPAIGLIPRRHYGFEAYSPTQRGQVVKLCGGGRDATHFELLDDCSEPIISVAGKPPNPEFRQHGAFKLKGLHFDGNGHRATWMSFRYSGYTDLEDVFVSDTVGCAINGFCWWDGNLVNCHFARNGDPDSDRAVIQVDDADEQSWEGYSNNITFTICRFEKNKALPIYLAHARKMRFVSCNSTTPRWNTLL